MNPKAYFHPSQALGDSQASAPECQWRSEAPGPQSPWSVCTPACPFWMVPSATKPCQICSQHSFAGCHFLPAPAVSRGASSVPEGIPAALPGTAAGVILVKQVRWAPPVPKSPQLPSLSEDTVWFLLARSFPASLCLASHHSGFSVVFVFILFLRCWEEAKPRASGMQCSHSAAPEPSRMH